MKKAEEYLKNVTAFTTREELYEIGKQIQIDAINETVELCAEKTRLTDNGKKLNTNRYVIEKYNTYHAETEIDVDKDSILDCAKILIDKL
jgi:hypothetical protein